jgi:ABC-type multidrug transport system permease subunit
MAMPLLLLVAHSALGVFYLYEFVDRSLERDWVWAGIYWVWTVGMAVGAMAWWYRVAAAYKWRHRHEHKV